MTGSTKRRTLLFLGLVMIVTLIVAAGLPGLELQPGMPRPSFERNQVAVKPTEEAASVVIQLSDFAKGLLAFAVAGVALFAAYRLARSLGWRKLASYLQAGLIGFSMVSAIVYLLSLALTGPTDASPLQLPLPTESPAATAPLGPAPAGLVWLIAAGLLVVSGLMGIWIFRSSTRRPPALNMVGLEAEKAWQALKTGLDLKGVIMQCYRQMSLALERDQGIEREEWMTPREFEDLLEAAGMPHDPIHQLTQLFEAVRYGDWQPNAADEQQAIQCLQAIMLHSREAGSAG